MKHPVKMKNTTTYTLVCDICLRPTIQPGDIYYDWIGADICKACFEDIRPGDKEGGTHDE